MDEDKLDELIEEATVDAHDEYEQRAGFYAALEDGVSFPFQAEVIGETVSVRELDMKGDERIMAVVQRNGKEHQVDLLDLQVDISKTKGGEWIAAYRRWCGDV